MLTMVRTEAIPMASMVEGFLPHWDWETIPEYLDSLDGAPKGVNCIQYMPTASLMTYVMGLDAAKTRPATDAELLSLCALRNVHEACATPTGATVRVESRDDVPHLVSHLVGQRWTIYGATPQVMTLEDVYFAIEAKVLSGAGQPSDHRIITTATTLGELDGRAA